MLSVALHFIYTTFLLSQRLLDRFRSLVASSVVGKVEREGNKLVKVSLICEAEYMEEGCLLLPRSEGWVRR